MSVLDAEGTIGRALRSLQDQTFSDWRLIVVDDGSRDGTADVIEASASEDRRIRLVRGRERLGLPTRLNQVIDLTKSPYFARMDADDVAYPERLHRQVEFLAAHPSVDLVGASMTVITHAGHPVGWRRAPADHVDICARPRAGFPLFHPTWFGRTEWFRRYGYAPRAVRCEDQELLLRAHRESNFANLEEPLLGYHEDPLTWLKLATGRVNFARAAIRDCRRQGSTAQGVQVALEQSLKAVVDALAIVTKTERWLLRHRARPMPPADLGAWEDLREALWTGSRTSSPL